ncbi:MAG: hypothetical protein ACFUZC_08855 [Chthoniobacteraceae bacterium]
MVTTPSLSPADFDLQQWSQPSAEYSLCPFWFWNDALDENEILRQIADFQQHGVDAFVIHPRVGLPRDTGWLSEKLFSFMRVAVKEARRRGMWIMLYDEGMYPSGSACGQVVAQDPSFHVRGLVCTEGVPRPGAAVPEDHQLIATVRRNAGDLVSIFDQPVDAVIRGLHYIGDESSPALTEDEPPAADLLNPAAAQCFIDLVYGRFFAEFAEYFGNTIKAIFTDEPNPLSRLRTPGVMPGTRGILEQVNRYLGYDFTPHLPALWFDDEPDAERYRRDYAEAIAARLNETYYSPLSLWCEAHGVLLAGHPAKPDDIGHLRYFHIPGQDIVWRDVEPGKATALEGACSTMAKAAASVAFHRGKQRNLNEFAGAFGPSLTFHELQWLASWVLIRGCNLLVPHAFYYSMRGPRKAERPPDVGPNSSWWSEYPAWAGMARRLCWLNTIASPVCEVAILGHPTELPWKAAKACFENQIDFHYIEPDDLNSSTVSQGRLCIGEGQYAAIVVEQGYETDLPDGTPVIRWTKDGLCELKKHVAPVVCLDRNAPALRARHLVTPTGVHLFLLFNEGEERIARRVVFPISGALWRLNPETGTAEHGTEDIDLAPHGWSVFGIIPANNGVDAVPIAK